MAALEQHHELLGGGSATPLIELENRLIECRQCPRLVEWREDVATTKRASYASEEYWGRPVPGFGDPDARIVIVGLAPAAHGANRTGRMFTGDRSGEWLYRAMHRAGLASKPDSVGRFDGLTLRDAWITSPVKCAPPQNKPTPRERDNCSEWFDEELRLLTSARVFVVLGQYGYQSLWAHLRRAGVALPSPRPKFSHGLSVDVGDLTILASYHVSQQNTFTGRLTVEMLDEVFSRAVGRFAQ
jgi:uracil-DNA glycosylase family 4